MGSQIFAIGGPHGSGKSSVAKRLALDLDLNYVSAGEIFRQLAKERGYTLKEFSNMVVEEPQIDRQIDARTEELGSQPKTIVDAQLAAYFTAEKVTLKICITASPEVRYQRIADREGKSLEDATSETKTREKTEKKRFSDLYGIDVENTSTYDVVINTDNLTLDQTYKLAKSVIENAMTWAIK